MNVFILFMAISSLPVFMSFLDFGIGQIVFNEITRPNKEKSEKIKEINSCVRGLTFISGFLIILNSLIFALGIYDYLVRQNTLTQRLIYFVAVNVLIATIPFLVGARIMLGAQKITLVILVQGLGTVLIGAIIYIVNYTFGTVPEIVAVLPAFLFFLGNYLLFRLAQKHYRIKILSNNSTLISSYHFLLNHRRVMIWSSLLSGSSNFFWIYPRFVLQKRVDPQDIIDFSFIILFLGSMQSLIGAYMAVKVPIFRNLNGEKVRKFFTYKAILENLAICVVLLGGLYTTVLLFEHEHFVFLSFYQMKLLIPILIVWSCVAVFVANRTEQDDLRFIFFLNFLSIIIVIMFNNVVNDGLNSVEEFTYSYFLPILILQLIGLILKFQFGDEKL